MLKLNVAIAVGMVAASSSLAMSPTEAVAGLEKTWNGLTSYSCRFDITSRRGDHTLHQGFLYQFRKPHLARLKVTSQPNRGADVVYDRDGKVRAAKRVLGIRFRKSMDMNDSAFYDSQGVPFWKADLGNQITGIRRILSLPGCIATVRTGKWDSRPMAILTLRYRDQATLARRGEHVYVDTWFLARPNQFPVHHTLSEDGVQVEEVTASEVNLRPALPASLFKL